MASSTPKPPIDPQRWKPPSAPKLEGLYARNRLLVDAVPLDTAPHVGPEDPVAAPDGRIFAGVDDGAVLRVDPDGGPPTVVNELVGGRPHGMEWHPDGWLVVCDSRRGGLWRVDPDGGPVELLTDSSGREPLNYTNNATVSADGRTIWFSESATVGNVDQHEADVYAHSGTGRLCRHDLDSGETETLIDDLQYANGVTLTPDGGAVLVAETTAYRIRRLAISGTNAGGTDYLVENLPGLPDNLTTGPTGTIWVAFPSPRNALLDLLLPAPGIIRKIVWALPDALRPDAKRMAFVIGLNAEGQVTYNLQDPDGAATHYVTGAREHDGHLYLGSLHATSVARYRLDSP